MYVGCLIRHASSFIVSSCLSNLVIFCSHPIVHVIAYLFYPIVHFILFRVWRIAHLVLGFLILYYQCQFVISVRGGDVVISNARCRATLRVAYPRYAEPKYSSLRHTLVSITAC